MIGVDVRQLAIDHGVDQPRGFGGTLVNQRVGGLVQRAPKRGVPHNVVRLCHTSRNGTQFVLPRR